MVFRLFSAGILILMASDTLEAARVPTSQNVASWKRSALLKNERGHALISKSSAIYFGQDSTRSVLVLASANPKKLKKFGQSGRLVIDASYPRAVVSDEKGGFYFLGSDYRGLFLIHFLSAGKADRRFGKEGLVRLKDLMALKYDAGPAFLARDAKGNLFVALEANTGAGWAPIYSTQVLKLNSQGKLDSQFQKSGALTLDLTEGIDEGLRGLEVTAQGFNLKVGLDQVWQYSFNSRGTLQGKKETSLQN